MRSFLLKGIVGSGLPVAPTEEELASLEMKITRAKPDDVDGYAWITGRNWAVDKVRSGAAAQRRLVRETARREEESRRAAVFEAAKREARGLIERLMLVVKPTQRDQLRLVWWKAFEGRSADDCAGLLPGTSIDCRVKKFQRGRSLLLVHGSPELRAFLSRRVAPSGGITDTPLPPSSG